MIDGVVLQPLRKIPDERGAVFHMLKQTDTLFEKFGEIYFTTIYPGIIKGWHRHKEMDLNYACVVGMVRVVIYDDRENSPTKGEINEFFIGEQNYALLHIPHGLINGMRGLGTNMAIVANCATLPHDPDEMERIEINSDKVPYEWKYRN